MGLLTLEGIGLRIYEITSPRVEENHLRLPFLYDPLKFKESLSVNFTSEHFLSEVNEHLPHQTLSCDIYITDSVPVLDLHNQVVPFQSLGNLITTGFGYVQLMRNIRDLNPRFSTYHF
jgi:hypothetical protein